MTSTISIYQGAMNRISKSAADLEILDGKQRYLQLNNWNKRYESKIVLKKVVPEIT